MKTNKRKSVYGQFTYEKRNLTNKAMQHKLQFSSIIFAFQTQMQKGYFP